MKPINKYLVNRRLTSEDRPKELTEEEVRSYILDEKWNKQCKKVTIQHKHGVPIVDIEGDFVFRHDITEIPFQFGTVTGDFDCTESDLTSLEGCPKEVGNNFYCYRCRKLTSLEGCPERVNNAFCCDGCGRKFTEQEVRSLCDVKGEIYV